MDQKHMQDILSAPLDQFLLDTDLNQQELLSQYKEEDFVRIGQIKIAADLVFEYFKDIMHDHRITLNESEHTRRIRNLLEKVVGVFGLTGPKMVLANYFIANVLKSYQDVEAEHFGTHAYMPYTESQLLELYDREKVMDVMAHMSPQDCCMYSGVFVSASTDLHEGVDNAVNALLAGCDLYFVQTLEGTYLVKTFVQLFPEYVDDDVLELTGRALLDAILNTPPL